jgi:hypothetical protein
MISGDEMERQISTKLMKIKNLPDKIAHRPAI